MFSASVYWLTALGCLAAGVGAGWVLRLFLDSSEQRVRDLERRLADSEASLLDYRRQVTEHFRGTAERVNRLTDDYRELHAHLAEGAMGLCQPTGEELPLLTGLGGSASRQPAITSVRPPLDYAAPRPDRQGSGADDLDSMHGA